MRSPIISSRGDRGGVGGAFIEEFYVPRELMGLVIGRGGSNIRAARAIPGINFIRLCESEELMRQNGGGDPIMDIHGNHDDMTLVIIDASVSGSWRSRSFCSCDLNTIPSHKIWSGSLSSQRYFGSLSFHSVSSSLYHGHNVCVYTVFLCIS